MPVRWLGQPGEVSPVSPSKNSSESWWRMNKLTELSRLGTVLVRTPISAPRERTSNGDGAFRLAGSPGTSVTVVAARVVAVIAHAGADE